MSNWLPSASLDILKQRAELLRKTRIFFEQRDILEVETPTISRFPTLDLHLEPFSLKTHPEQSVRYLITSPEYQMKRLLAAGTDSIFQICKAFRRDESGHQHNPEFTMMEWYRVGWDHWQLMEEVEELLDELLDCGKADRMSYAEAFSRFLNLDPFSLTLEDFLDFCAKSKVIPPAYLKKKDNCRDEWLIFLAGMFIEPKLGLDRPVFIHDYPSTQANLAKIYPENPELAMRFELFFQGMELGNGFCELTDSVQQKKRFYHENQLRNKSGKMELPVDVSLLAALEQGLPDCAGVALGLDRIVMLKTGKKTIDDVITFPWNRS